MEQGVNSAPGPQCAHMQAQASGTVGSMRAGAEQLAGT